MVPSQAQNEALCYTAPHPLDACRSSQSGSQAVKIGEDSHIANQPIRKVNSRGIELFNWIIWSHLQDQYFCFFISRMVLSDKETQKNYLSYEKLLWWSVQRQEPEKGELAGWPILTQPLLRPVPHFLYHCHPKHSCWFYSRALTNIDALYGKLTLEKIELLQKIIYQLNCTENYSPK